MSRFFFSFRHTDRILSDHEGVEFPDAYAARREALLVVRDLLDKRTGALPPEWRGWALTIRDENSRLVLDLPFAAALKLANALGSASALDRQAPTARVVPLRLARVHKRFMDLRREMRRMSRSQGKLLENQRKATIRLADEIKTTRAIVAQSRALIARSRNQAGAEQAAVQPQDLGAKPPLRERNLLAD